MSLKSSIAQWAEDRIRLPLAGLDISDRSVKYAYFEPASRAFFPGAGMRGAVRLAAYGEVEIPEGVIVEGALARADDLARILREVGDRAGRAFRVAGMVAALPEEKSFLQLIQIPRVAPDAMAGAVRWGMEGQIPIRAEDAIYDYEELEVMGANPGHRDIVITAFARDVVLEYTRAIKTAGLLPYALELESQAIVRAAVSRIHSLSPEARVVVDMGRSRTSFILCVGTAIIFTATLPIGGRVLEHAIGKVMGVDGAEAQRVKKEIGLSKTAHEGKVFAALEPSMESMAVELRRVIDYYRDRVTHVHGGPKSVGMILLSGGDANLAGITTYLASATRVPVVCADPLRGLRGRMPGAVPVIPRNQALAFTAAIGLALRGQERA